MPPLARLTLDQASRALRVEADPGLGLEGAGLPCALLVQGEDPFGRPLCRRCPVLPRLKGTWRAEAALRRQGRRLRCLGYAQEGGYLVELYPEKEAPDPLQELARFTRHLLDHPDRFLEDLEAYLRALREALGMEAAELFLLDPAGQHLILTAYEGPHREAFLERPWFHLGEGYPGLVALRRTPFFTHSLPEDPRFLRQKVKRLGYRTYIGQPLALPQGLIGVLNLASRDPEADHGKALETLDQLAPLLASALYTLLTRLGEVGLEALAPHLAQGQRKEALKALLQGVRRKAQATGLRLRTQDGEALELGFVPPCAPGACPAWGGEILGRGHGLPPCPLAQGRPRICLPFWAQGRVVGVGTLFHARPPRPATAPAALALWLTRLALPLLLPPGAGSEEGYALEVYALGGFRVRHRGQELTPQAFRRRSAWRLLKLLLAHKDRALYLEEVAELLFPEMPPEKARQELYSAAYHLRRVLPGLLEREGAYYRVRLPENRFLDFERFEALMRRADLEEGPQAFQTLRAALELYKGPLFGDDPYGEWAEAERAYLQDRALRGLLRLGELAEALGHLEAAREAYARALRLEPFLEEARARLQALEARWKAS